MDVLNKLKHKKYCLLFLVLFNTTPVLASVCFTLINFQVYGYSLLSEDFNNDGIIDKYEINDKHSIISLSQEGQAYGNIYQIYENWAISNEMLLGSVDGIPTNIIGFDANNDGFKDIAAAFVSRIVIRINNKNGGFSETEQFINLSDLYGIEESLLSDTLIQYGATLAVLDINLDGYQDLVVVHAEGVSIFLNDTTGKLNHLKNIKIVGFPRDDIRVVYVSDLDGDSLPEIIISAVGSHVIYFAEDMSVDMVSLTNQFDVLEPSDVDLDGDIDLTELDVQIFDPCNAFQTPVFKAYWINNGNGVFEKTTTLPLENINEIGESDVGNKESGVGSINLQYILVLLILFFTRSSMIRSNRPLSMIEKLKH